MFGFGSAPVSALLGSVAQRQLTAYILDCLLIRSRLSPVGRSCISFRKFLNLRPRLQMVMPRPP